LSWGVGDVITVAVKKAIKGKVAAGTVRCLGLLPKAGWLRSQAMFPGLETAALKSLLRLSTIQF